MSPDIVLFAIVIVAATALFGWSCFRRFRLITLGRDEDRFDKIGERLKNTLVYAFGQRRVLKRPFGINHVVLYWCFLILFLANAEFVLHGLFPAYVSLSRLPTGLYYTLAFIFDLASLLALLAVLVALSRRLFLPPPHIEARSRDSFVILSLVAVLMIAFFGVHASEIAQGTEAAARFMPVSALVAAAFMSGAPLDSLVGAAGFFWWLHALVLLGFLNYLPYSKHLHILTAIPNCYFRRLDNVKTQSREEFTAGNTYGVERVEQFTWKDLFDSYSCTECGRCSDACPATFTGKPLDPRLVVHDIKANLLKNGSQIKNKTDRVLPLIGGGQVGSVSEEVIWECTTCGACVEECPVFIEQYPRIIDMRRYLVEMQARFPDDLSTLFENMEQRSNPWGMAPAERTKWTADMSIRPFEAGKTEYLFFIGCAGALSARSRETTRSIARILDAAGISWGILGRDELCCGDSVRRLGNEFVFDRMAEENIKLFTEKGITRMITPCPHCFSSFHDDYRQYGLELEVIHHTELISHLLKENRLKLNHTVDLGDVVFHDSCYLGRYHQIYEAPREIVASVTGRAPIEMERHHSRSFCCGGGGGHMWMEEHVGKPINVARIEQALEKDPATICVSCPYCMTMLEDGLKDKNADDKVRVLDVAEIVARAL